VPYEPGPDPVVRIRVSWCKGCGLCVEYCSRGVLEIQGASSKAVHAERCTRCLQCEAICPDFAIKVEDPPREVPRSGNVAR
jgi:2-oxoglutarate ferredoxin oxidoreductase subunit delta